MFILHFYQIIIIFFFLLNFVQDVCFIFKTVLFFIMLQMCQQTFFTFFQTAKFVNTAHQNLTIKKITNMHYKHFLDQHQCFFNKERSLVRITMMYLVIRVQ